MKLNRLFESLDLDGDGLLSRADLHAAARALGWGWPEAPVYAVLDLLTIREPLSREVFAARMAQILRDPHGPYGEVLLDAPGPEPGGARLRDVGPDEKGPQPEEPVALLQRVAGEEAAGAYGELLVGLEEPRLPADRAALLIIDPQRSFTGGAWMRSMGRDARRQVEPIGRAFAACGQLLGGPGPRPETVFTRCAFPPDSYGWDERVAGALPEDQVYFVKPGNSVLWPVTNGFTAWAEALAGRGVEALVLGGCTLNSCLRVSAVEIRRQLADCGVRVVVDLSLCGARTSNYVPSPLWDDLSSVESAVRQMQAAGVEVTWRVVWS